VAVGLRIGPVGLRMGPRMGTSAGAGYTKDSGSSWAVPQNSGEWAALMAIAGLSGSPTECWDFGAASGNITGRIAGLNLTATAGSPALEYRQELSGWESKWAGPSGDNSSGKFESTAAGLPDVLTVSALLGAYVYQAVAPAASREFLALGVGVRMAARITTTPIIQGNNGTNIASGAANPTGSAQFVIIEINRNLSRTAVYTMAEKIVPTWAATMTGKRALFGGAGLSAPRIWYRYGFLFSGAQAERSQAYIKTLMTCMANGTAPLWTAA
jgi:hypothetical protein